MRIPGCTAIITGASSGIGRAAARELAAARANVVLAARSRDKLEDLARDIAPLPGRCLVVPTDVTDRLAVEALVRRTLEEFGAVDILVNNAGVGLFAPIAGGSLDNMRRLFDVNLWGAVHCIQAAVPYMQSQRRGHIVNVSSVAGRLAPPYMGIYAASKFALRAVSDALRSELAGSGVGVSTIYPGLTQTNFMEHMIQELEAPALPPIARFVDARVVGRRIVQAVRWNLRDVFISPEDVLGVTLNAVVPQLVDWGMRMFIRPERAAGEDISLPREDAEEYAADAGESEPA
ncbi:MAG: SDR family NAD(P)-dependent oxidoreductase [Dehalococcoidia bacterium]|nr:SDR family NAD(P)-dependent oxidoreductase [Dehalococcoidia bacterium]